MGKPLTVLQTLGIPADADIADAGLVKRREGHGKDTGCLFVQEKQHSIHTYQLMLTKNNER